jgi:3-hydroxyacyl-[acyl-carrier-protein] dehydratase
VTLDREQIMLRIPHRPPILMLDRVEELVERTQATGVTTVGCDSDWLRGHFPGEPIMPGVLLVECMAQVAAVMFAPPPENGRPFSRKYFARIERVTFRRPVRPGTTLRTHVKALRVLGRLLRVEGRASDDSGPIADGILVLYDVDAGEPGHVRTS